MIRTFFPGVGRFFMFSLGLGLLLPTPGFRPSLARAAEPVAPPGFTAIFNGKDLTGWHGWAIHEKNCAGPAALAKLSAEDRAKKIEAWTEDAKKHWSVQNGELVNDGKGAYLATDKDFGDFELLIEYKTVPKADSGIYLRATPQIQIWDPNGTFDPKKPDRKPNLGSGGLFNNTPNTPGRDPLVLADKPFGEWNTFRIVMVGERVTVHFNGKLVVDHNRMENYWDKQAKKSPAGPLPKAAPIVLQTHGGEIRWRNIFLREIPATEANDILRKHGGDGFEDIFNGKDLTGWAGATDVCEVKDGAIVWKLKKAGNIYFNKEYGDFVARLDYKLPPAGNNGLAIRYPGKRRASQDAMCEIQIMDDTAAKYDKADARQANGSAYGMAAAHKGYLRPLGEWNFMELTVKGHTIQTELNGTRILETDLSKVTDYMKNFPHPGKDRLTGYFGFAGHNDPVEFKNLRVKPLK